MSIAAVVAASGLELEPVTEGVRPVPQPCEGCTMCCKLMGVKEIDKPAGRWCELCAIGKGCKAYDTRPPSCRDFSCAYAQGLLFDIIEARPDNSKVVFSFTNDGKWPVAYVDPSRPEAWREGAVGRWFTQMVRELGKGIVVIGARHMAVGEGWSEDDLETILKGGVH